MLTIYGSPQSRTMRVLWAATELGLGFKNVPVTFEDQRLKQADYLKINPSGRMPAIEDDGFALSESLTINLYLAKKFGTGGLEPLYPESLQEEAKIWQWSFWALAEMDTLLETIRAHRSFLPSSERDENLAIEAERKLQRPLRVLEAAISESSYLVRPHFTIADLNVAAVLSPSRTSTIDLAVYPGIRAWLSRCFTRPAAVAARQIGIIPPSHGPR
jgi:glutathione S-transferase